MAQSAEVLAQGQAVWVCPGTDGLWLPGYVRSLSSYNGGGGQLVQVQLPGSEVVEVDSQACRIQNAGNVDDMVDLNHLHEPGVLHNLEERYSQDKIYTCTGSILIAVNPFKVIPQLLGPKVMGVYEQNMMSSKDQPRLPPHVYGTAVTAYKQMLQDGAGQAILITGESGAGKTETCKLIMRCLAHLGAAKEQARGPAAGLGVEQKVLESNPLLEAFGNAKTSRNDNSSRFGKYVEIQFDSQGQLQGAAIRTYLLERSRVVHVLPGERSFHAFYQVCAGASPAERATWQLEDASHYAVLRQSECRKLEGVDDAAEYQHTRNAMTAVGIDPAQQEAVFATLAAILHLGNVQWAEAARAPEPPANLRQLGYSKSCAACADGPCPADAASWQALHWAAQLWRVSGPQMLAGLSSRTRQTPDGPITSPLTVAGANEARDSLCKVVYARLFAWLVACINASLEQQGTKAATSPTANGGLPNGSMANGNGMVNGVHSPAQNGKYPHGPAHKSNSTSHLQGPAASPQSSYTIGLLDIYGFESFEVNDLEQLCINLANEKLQQHFNQHVFKWEQAEYMREGVDWRYIDFVDNQEVLDLVEGKLGLLDLLDEQCRFPTATAQDLAHKYSSTPSVASSKRFEKLKRVPTGFAIQHYAGSVNYKTDNFLDKNKDYVVAEHAALMSASYSPLVASLFPQQTAKGAGMPGAGNLSAFKFDSIASQFKRQLADLMATLHVMQPHYVRCIKPSPLNKAGVYDKRYVLNQLRCGGVMEAVRISCAGFAYKRTYQAFLEHFWPVCPSAWHTVLRKARAAQGLHHSQSAAVVQGTHAQQQQPVSLEHVDVETLKAAAQQVLAAAGVSGYHLGHTKLFMKSAQAATLDKHRALIFGKAATHIQAYWKMRLTKQWYQQMRAAALLIQCSIRGWLARTLAERLRREKAATLLQSLCRARRARLQLQQAQAAAACLQGAWRARQARLGMQEIRRDRAACVLQAAWRSRAVHLMYERQIRQVGAAVLMQAVWRGVLYRKQFQEVLPRHRAAARIQAAWRSSRDGNRVREAFRQVVLQAVRCEKAAVVLQRACRCRLARKQYDRLHRVIRRQRFQEQVLRFQEAVASSSCGPAALFNATRSGALSPSMTSPRTLSRQVTGDIIRGAQDTRRKEPPKDVVRELDVEEHLPHGSIDALLARRDARLKEVAEVTAGKLNSVLSVWQQREQQASRSPPAKLKPSQSSNGRSYYGWGISRSSTASPISEASYGTLLSPMDLSPTKSTKPFVAGLSARDLSAS